MIIGKQCRPRSDTAECGFRSGSPLFANSSTIFLWEYLTYLKSKIESSNILCGAFIQSTMGYSVHHITTGGVFFGFVFYLLE